MKQLERVRRYKKNLVKCPLFSEVVGNETMSESSAENVINYVFAPALNGFVAWVLAESMKQGIRRLYFLARDGYFLYQTARVYVDLYDLPIECRYFYCSRYSIRRPNYHMDLEKALDYITLGGLDVTMDKIYRRAGLDGKQRERMQEEAIVPFQIDEQIPRQRLENVKKVLRNSKLFTEILEENSRKVFPAFEQYLTEEGLLEKLPMALVDSGWVGSMQKELNLSLQRLGKRNSLKGFYWGLYEVPAGVKREDYRTYFFDPEGGLRRKVGFNNCLFESIVTAPHGMTIGYEKKEGKTEPQLAAISPDRRERLWTMEKLLAKWMGVFLQKVDPKPGISLLEELGGQEVRRIIESNMELFMHHPTEQEAIAFGGLEFTDDILEYEGNQIAAKLNERELLQNHLWGRILGALSGRKRHVKQSAWYEGSAVLYGKHPKYHIFQYSCYKYAMNYRKRSIWRKNYGSN